MRLSKLCRTIAGEAPDLMGAFYSRHFVKEPQVCCAQLHTVDRCTLRSLPRVSDPSQLRLHVRTVETLFSYIRRIGCWKRCAMSLPKS